MTIFKKSLITLGIGVLTFSALFIISVMVFMNSLYYQINMASLDNTTEALMAAIGKDRLIEIFSANDEYHPNQVSLPLSGYDAYRLTLIAPSGYVLWDSHVEERMVNHIDREEVIAALEGREKSSRRESISTGIQRIYYAMPVFDNDNNSIGVFRLSFSIPDFRVRVSPVLIPFIIFICLFFIAAFWAIIVYSSSLSASLRRLVNIAQSNTLLLSSPKTAEQIAPEFRSLEKAMRAVTKELNLRFEQAKAESSRLEAILNGMSEAVFAMDCTLKLHLVNPKARELFCLGNNDIKTMSLLEAVRSAELAETANKAIYNCEPLETELTLHTSTEQHFLVYTSPLIQRITDKNTGLKAEGVIIVLQDITRLVKLERIRKDFVANVSHELRTPIQIIKGFSENLLDSLSDKQINHFIEIIHKNAGIMENLTNDLLILADLENTGINARGMEELDIASLVNEAVSSVESHAKLKQIEITVKCHEGLTAMLNGSLIIQALINLIDNGIKYSPAKSKIKVSTYLENDEVVFEVRDKGIGISAEHLERIFERFYRVDRARSREAQSAKGTGLGLSIVRHIALLHKGTAEAESHAGEGSIFRIRIQNQQRDQNHHH
jgi:two-component system phosphate regulon sensor histidine kinase PhoR